MLKATIAKCPHGVLMASLDGENSGYRLTANKCCGSWTNIKSTELSERDLLEIRAMVNAEMRLKRRDAKKEGA